MIANKLASTPRTMRTSIVQAKPSINARRDCCAQAWGKAKATTIDKAAAIEEVRVLLSDPLFLSLSTSTYHILLLYTQVSKQFDKWNAALQTRDPKKVAAL